MKMIDGDLGRQPVFDLSLLFTIQLQQPVRAVWIINTQRLDMIIKNHTCEVAFFLHDILPFSLLLYIATIM